MSRPGTIRLWTVLTVLLAAGYAYVGIRSPLPAIRWTALAGAALIAAALWLAGRSRAAAMVALVIGALTPALLAWWSLVLPLTGLLALVCGTLAIRAAIPATPAGQPGT
jgi:hypothetical protein